MQRRQFLKSALALSLTGSVGLSIAEQRYRLTPSDYEGPFYPVDPRDGDGNVLMGSPLRPGDDRLDFNGELVTPDGRPIGGAIIDIWHTDPQGRYKHPRDRGQGERRRDFAYWGKATTDAAGKFDFVTLIPGAYSPRPAHIHYKVWQGNKRLLTSQLYFRDLGGTLGRSRNKDQSELQLTDLTPVADHHFETFFRIVV